MQKTEKNQQPPWHKPTAGRPSGIFVKNSLKTATYEEIIPEEGNILRWYTCGPTVYDSSHLGHARNYITFDILRRIIAYFGYDIFYCMNITDIDDKIILRSRRNHLYDEYLKKEEILSSQVIADLTEAWQLHIQELIKKITENEADQQEGKRSLQELEAEADLLKSKFAQAKYSYSEIINAQEGTPAKSFIQSSEEPLSVVLDNRHGNDLDSEFVKKLCDEHSKKYEKEFFEDMKILGVQPPDVLVRVSEYIPQVIEMVQKILQNGLGYVSDSSVYFDTIKFHSSPGHSYAKLKPSCAKNLRLLAEGEGALGSTGDRLSESDFALWKKSKPGEPSWNSPWGKGRPGWHIECSAMASVILGKVLDIHCGGADLKFPHHDNELAQAEAYYGHDQWVNYFLHSGHLDIDGLKMSKSLKNFITIRHALQNLKHTPRQLRFYFLLHTWNKRMNYQRTDTMKDVQTKEKFIIEFLMKAKQLKIDSTDVVQNESWNHRDTKLHQALLDSQTAIDKALKDNFDTKKAILQLMDLISATNSYYSANNERKVFLISKITNYVTSVLDMFGLDFSTAGSMHSSTETREEVVRPFVKATTTFRKKIREGVKAKEGPGYFMAACDELRDNVLPQLGVKVVDDSEFDYFLVDKQQYLEEIEAKKAGQNKELLLKKLNVLSLREKDLAKWEELKLSPTEALKKKYNINMESEKNVPDEDLNGKKISPQNKKKILKDWKNQVSNNEKFQKELLKNPNFFEDATQVVQKLKSEIDQLMITAL